MLWVFLLMFSTASLVNAALNVNTEADPASLLKLPAGFKTQIFAKLDSAGQDYFRGPRMMAFDNEGNLYVSLGRDNKVIMLSDINHDGVADGVTMVADNLNSPNGLAFSNGSLLVANQDGVVRLQKQNGQWPTATVTPIISGLATGGHTLKTIKIGPDGYLYINVGSSCNVCAETDPQRATILRYTLDGKPAGALTTLGWHAPTAVWASGLRNSQGFAWHPKTGAMFATNNGADNRSDSKGGAANDEVPPEHLNRIEPGKNYGWPYCWGNHVADPNFISDDGYCATTPSPDITFAAHSTPIGITFLNQAKFPTEYKNDAIVALHGSWNRKALSGYKLVRVKFDEASNPDKPTEVIDFATGWLNNNSAWGRPVDVIVGTDGALYVSDDRAGLIYRITYTAAQ
jgi:glucose/arabinose dehydrogenase